MGSFSSQVHVMMYEVYICGYATDRSRQFSNQVDNIVHSQPICIYAIVQIRGGKLSIMPPLEGASIFFNSCSSMLHTITQGLGALLPGQIPYKLRGNSISL